MLTQPLVSVIVNCFNGEKYLRTAINSIIKQSYNNWEIIFWDNQSTDQSAKIFKSFEDNRLKYFYAPLHTKILYKARNYALKKAKGDFIAFLDVDDWWLPNKLEKQIPLFQDSKVGMVYGNLWCYFEKENRKKIYRRKKLPSGMILNELLNDYSIGSPTYVIRKKSLESLSYYFNERFHIIGDFDLNLRLATNWQAKCVQDPIAYLRIHGQNESLLNRGKEIEELKNWYAEKKNDLNFSSKDGFKKIPLKILYLDAMESMTKGDFKKGFIKVIKYPFSFEKLKLFIALLVPKTILKKIKNY